MVPIPKTPGPVWHHQSRSQSLSLSSSLALVSASLTVAQKHRWWFLRGPAGQPGQRAGGVMEGWRGVAAGEAR